MKETGVKFPIWASVFTVLGVLVLCTLGGWQLQRLEWKSGIIAGLEAEYAKDAAQNPLAYNDLIPPSDALFLRRGTAVGTLDYSKDIAIEPRVHDGKIGYHIITPLTLKGGGVVLINRGWAADKSSLEGLQKNVEIIGIARRPDHNAFTSKNAPVQNRWLRLDIADIAAAKGLKNVAPVILYAESAAPAFTDTQPEATRWQPNNDHLQYTVFWFVMAGVLLCIFMIWVFKKEK